MYHAQYFKKNFNARYMLLRAKEGVDHEAFDYEEVYGEIAKLVSARLFDCTERFEGIYAHHDRNEGRESQC